MTKKHSLPSGAVLEITPLPWEEAWEISQKIAAIIKQVNIDFKSLAVGNVGDLLKIDVMFLKDALCDVVASKAVFEAAKHCFKRCTIGGLKIDNMTFEAVDARGDFIPAAIAALSENISPFFQGVLNSFLQMK